MPVSKLTLVLLGAVIAAIPALAEAQPRPPNAVFGPLTKKTAMKADKAARKKEMAQLASKLKAELASAKSELKQVQPLYKEHRTALKQASGEQLRAARAFNAANSRVLFATQADAANSTPQTRFQLDRARVETDLRKQQLNASASKFERANETLEKTGLQRSQALNRVMFAREAVKRRSPGVGAPTFAAAAALAPGTQPSSYAVVQQSSLVSLMNPSITQLRKSSSASSSGGAEYGSSYRQSDRSIRSSGSFRSINSDSARSEQ